MNTSPETDLHQNQPRSFVRRNGRMTTGQEHAWAEYAPDYMLDMQRDGGATTVAKGDARHPADIFGREARVVVEIGTGDGEALVHAATEHPDTDFIGIEVYQAGLARAMLNAHKRELTNVRLIEANAPEVLENYLPENSIDELRVFFPDPWHKARHNKRRLIAPPFLTLTSRVLVTGGLVRMATDWEEYAEQMREVFDADPLFTRDFSGEWAERFAGRPITNFERKGTDKGRNIRDLTYRYSPTQ